MDAGHRLRRQTRRRDRQRRNGRDARARDGEDRCARDDAAALADVRRRSARAGCVRERPSQIRVGRSSRMP